MLKTLNIKHIIARTSNKDEPKRFRLILDLDELTDFSEINYKKFAKTITHDLNIDADYLSPAQVYFAYAHSNPLCYFEEKQILLTGYVKDAVGRFQTQMGRRVERRFGWDTHGLPAELEVQRLLGINNITKI